MRARLLLVSGLLICPLTPVSSIPVAYGDEVSQTIAEYDQQQPFQKIPTKSQTPAASSAIGPANSKGVVDPKVTLKEICTPGNAQSRRKVSSATKLKVCKAAGLISCHGVIIDHIVPLELGGANVIGNLQAQTPQDSHAKDLVENATHQAVCKTPPMMTLTDAQQMFMTDGWKK